MSDIYDQIRKKEEEFKITITDTDQKEKTPARPSTPFGRFGKPTDKPAKEIVIPSDDELFRSKMDDNAFDSLVEDL